VRRVYCGFLIPGLSTLAMLLVLIGLGTWQIYRLHWKQGVLAQIAVAEAARPIPLPLNPEPYTKVSVTGHFAFDQAAQFGAEVRDTKAGSTMGSYQIVPLVRKGGTTILVDRGWIPQKRETPLNDPAGEVSVVGYVRSAEVRHWYSPTDDEAARQFYTLDPKTIGAAVGAASVAPFVLIALGASTPEIYPAPGQHLPRPPSNHLSYAITWYGLAVVLGVIFGVWLRKALPR
jgi:surfeit locus 1 family protein